MNKQMLLHLRVASEILLKPERLDWNTNWMGLFILDWSVHGWKVMMAKCKYPQVLKLTYTSFTKRSYKEERKKKPPKKQDDGTLAW